MPFKLCDSLGEKNHKIYVNETIAYLRVKIKVDIFKPHLSIASATFTRHLHIFIAIAKGF